MESQKTAILLLLTFQFLCLLQQGKALTLSLFGGTTVDNDIMFYTAIGFLALCFLLLITMVIGLCFVMRKIKKREEQLRDKSYEDQYIRKFGLPLPRRMTEAMNNPATPYWVEDWNSSERSPSEKSRMYADYIIEDADRMCPIPRATVPGLKRHEFAYINAGGPTMEQTKI